MCYPLDSVLVLDFLVTEQEEEEGEEESCSLGCIAVLEQMDLIQLDMK